jgi:hypothetical protein
MLSLKWLVLPRWFVQVQRKDRSLELDQDEIRDLLRIRDELVLEREKQKVFLHRHGRLPL